LNDFYLLNKKNCVSEALLLITSTKEISFFCISLSVGIVTFKVTDKFEYKALPQ